MIKAYWPSIVALLAALAVFLMLAAAQGCSLDRIVSVNVPPDVAKATGSPAKVKLADARVVRAKYVADYERGLTALDANVDDAEAIASLGASLLDIGVDYGAVAIGNAAVPGGSVLIAGLTGLAGVLAGRTNKRQAVKDTEAAIRAELDAVLRKEKQDSYNAGISIAADKLGGKAGA